MEEQQRMLNEYAAASEITAVKSARGKTSTFYPSKHIPVSVDFASKMEGFEHVHFLNPNSYDLVKQMFAYIDRVSAESICLIFTQCV